jgi:hypothetical protein
MGRMGGCALIMKLFFWEPGVFDWLLVYPGAGRDFFGGTKMFLVDGGLAFTEGGKENVLTQTSIE